MDEVQLKELRYAICYFLPFYKAKCIFATIVVVDYI